MLRQDETRPDTWAQLLVSRKPHEYNIITVIHLQYIQQRIKEMEAVITSSVKYCKDKTRFIGL